MAYFDPSKDTELTTDASPVGLSDDCKIVAYVRRSLSDVETRYSQTEKEALAIVWETTSLPLWETIYPLHGLQTSSIHL